jgi:O-6-methylguanine DNA methyltransferase
MSKLEDLQQEWKTLYASTLPQLAKAKDPAQPKWPVTLDHCFARIILDNTVGEGKQQWDKVISKPAVRNMTEEQLQNAINLGLQIIAGNVDICELDNTSLQCRGKNEGKYGKPTATEARQKPQPASASSKRKRQDDPEHSPKRNRKADSDQSTLDFWKKQTDGSSDASSPTAKMTKQSPKRQQLSAAEYRRILKQIRSHAKLTPYRQRLYTILLSVPEGRYTTYAAMSEYLNSAARAVGNGMRNNPFAPEVPCHRVLAADGSIGGFKGDWGKDGKHAAKKIELLRSEGVRFDPKGKVIGEPFRKFHEFEHLKEGAGGEG